jgi:hypothetical protein
MRDIRLDCEQALAAQPKAGLKKMRRHRAAEQSLREAVADGDVFEETEFLRCHSVGLGSLGRFLAEGWIVHNLPIGGSYRITEKGRAGLDALAAQPNVKRVSR